MSSDKPTFDVAVARFRAFLRKANYLEEIRWIQPEDVLISGERFVHVKVPLQLTNEAKARQSYEEGLRNGRGVVIKTICELPNATCCCVWHPESAEDMPEGIWPQDGSLKMSADIGLSRIPGKIVRSRLMWRALEALHGAKQDKKRLLFGKPGLLVAREA